MSDITDGNRTVQLAGFGRLADNNHGKALQFFGFLGCFFKQSLVAGFQFRTLLFKISNVCLRRAQSFVLRQQIVTGISALNVNLIAHFA